MIKVNLLDSVTDRAKGVAAVEQKVANPRMQTLLLALVVFGLLTAGMLYDYYSSSSARESVQAEKAEQERIQTQMVAVNKERADLEKKTADIQARIDAIQKLRASQQGPGAVLREIKSRFDSVPGLYLRSVEQNGTQLTIKGESPNETSVTNFAKSLEFSSGLFKDLSIETQREEVKAEEKAEGAAPAAPEDKDAPKPEVVTFTIKCTFTPEPPASPAAGQPAPANQIAQK
ncbi:MAG TPA: PilN domain-containing protein [Pyrinomonadaceae bacterium]|nr:PilN domain-containing protein [Pyrinomonadaceae bacterium]